MIVLATQRCHEKRHCLETPLMMT